MLQSRKTRSEPDDIDNRLALTLCVKNEADIIEDYLMYHHYLGIERAYVFLDGCTDDTANIVSHFPWAKAIEIERSADWKFNRELQNPCAKSAMEMALEEGFDWLLHVDADEFAWGDNPADDLLERGCLKTLVSRAKPATEQIRLACKEAVAIRNCDHHAPWEQCYFQAGSQTLSRDVMDPISGEVKRLSKWLGHRIGKSIVKVGEDIVPVSPHEWARSGSEDQESQEELVTEFLGFHAHYVLGLPAKWHEKYRKHGWTSDRWITGQQMPFPRQAWKKASLTMSDEEAKAYFEEWIGIDQELAIELHQTGQLEFLTDVRDAVLASKN